MAWLGVGNPGVGDTAGETSGRAGVLSGGSDRIGQGIAVIMCAGPSDRCPLGVAVIGSEAGAVRREPDTVRFRHV